jgi:serine/threonine protein kinase
VYDLLRPIQGIHVPVHLGNIDLATPYYYEGICELVHMMFLSFGGKRISQCLTTGNRSLITQEVDHSAQAIHNLGVLHKDLEPRNILWNEETGRVMVIDFERAEVAEQRAVLGIISPNRKRKRGPDASMAKQGGDRSSVFARERQRAAIELRGLRLIPQ